MTNLTDTVKRTFSQIRDFVLHNPEVAAHIAEAGSSALSSGAPLAAISLATAVVHDFGLNVVSGWVGDAGSDALQRRIEKHQFKKDQKEAIEAAKQKLESLQVSEDKRIPILICNVLVELAECTQSPAPKEKAKSESKTDELNMIHIAGILYSEMSGIPLEEHLAQNSKNYQTASKEDRQLIVEFLQATITEFLHHLYITSDTAEQRTANIIVWALSRRMDGIDGQLETIRNLLAQTRLQRVQTADKPSEISFKAIGTSFDVPRHRLLECPSCKYNGPRLYLNPSNNVISCPACESSHQMVESLYPEIIPAIKDMANEILAEIQANGRAQGAGLKGEIEELATTMVTREHLDTVLSGSNETVQELRATITQKLGSIEKDIHKLIGSADTTQKIQDLLEKQEKAEEALIDTVNQKLADLEKAVRDTYDNVHMHMLSGISGDLMITIKDIHKDMVTKEYMESALVGRDIRHEESPADFKKVLEKICSDIQTICRKGNGREELQNLRESLHNAAIVGEKHLQSIDKTVEKLYNYVEKEFHAISVQQDTLMNLIEKLCLKEYLEDFRGSLGTKIDEAIRVVMSTDSPAAKKTDPIQALSISQVSQIISVLKDLNEKADRQSFDEHEVQKLLRDELTKTAGQILSLENLIKISRDRLEKKMDDIDLMLREINRKIDEKSVLQVGEALMTHTNWEHFKKIYHGKIPSKYMADGGYGIPFECPFCGISEARIINEDQYCRCSVCREEYIPINPDKLSNISEETGKEEEDLPSHRTVAQWFAKHRVTNENGIYEFSGEGRFNEVIIVDSAIGMLTDRSFSEEIRNSVKVILFTEEAVRIDAGFFNDFYMLETIVFQQNHRQRFPVDLVGTEDDLVMSKKIRAYGARKICVREKENDYGEE